MAGQVIDHRVRTSNLREITRWEFRAAQAIVTGWVAGCARAPAPQPAPTPVAARAQPVATTEHGGFPPRFVVGHAVYEITAVGLVSDPSDSVTHPDTVTTRTSLTYDARPLGPQLQVNGEIISRVTTASATSPHTDPLGGTRTTFQATVDTASGAVTVSADTTSPLDRCQGHNPSVDQARQLATTRPRSFVPATTWHDVATDSSCLGGLPLVSRATREYSVAPQNATDPVTGTSAVLIAHTSTTSMAGSGHRAGHYITLTGNGTGTTEEYYDRKTGVLLSAHTAATLDLDITVSGRVQRLHQQADWRARLKAGDR